jgi:uncharacterized protein (TIGR00290 family)
MPAMSKPILMAWSGGKDCLMALQALQGDPAWDVVALLTTVTGNLDRVSMHGTRRELLEAQARALGLPLLTAEIEWPSSNEAYEAAQADALARARERWPRLRHVAFGDLFLEDVRSYREAQLARAGWEGVFPVWGAGTSELAHRFVRQGHRALLVCVDITQLDAGFCGRDFDPALLRELPPEVDPCGERGEFHTLVHGGPMFAADLSIERGESLLRDERFQYQDVLLADAG